MEPALSYLEASDCLDQTLNCLQTVTVISVQGSKLELLLLKLLLDHSPRLKKMIIHLRTTVDAHKRLNFAKDVMGFPRVSENAEILMVEPKLPNQRVTIRVSLENGVNILQ